MSEQPGGQDDVDDFRNCLHTGPVPLKFAGQGNPADRLRPGLDDTFEAGSVRLRRSSADGIDHRVNLESFPKYVEGWECETHLSPERGHDQLPATGRLNGVAELSVFPRVELSTVDFLAAFQNGPEFRDGGSWPWATWMVDSTTGRSNVLAKLATDTMLSTSSWRSIDVTVWTWLG